MSYANIVIYYFSGTGNTAKIVTDIANETDLLTNVFDVSSTAVPENINEEILLGFAYPTHGFNAPPIMLKYIWNFPKGKADVFLVNTRAGMKIHKLFTPGLGGIALWMPALILKIKGYKVKAYRPVDMPSNWVSLHPGMKAKVNESIVKRCEITTAKFTNKIVNKQRVLHGFIYLPFDILVAPIALVYYLLGRFALAKTFYANSNCNNCKLCIKQCPLNAVVELDGRPFWKASCESCVRCLNSCPKRAIETSHAYSILLWWVLFSVLPIGVINLLIRLNVAPDFVLPYQQIIEYVVMFSLGMPLLFGAYRIFHFLLKFKLFNKLFSLTSLTHYKFWRRYKLPDKSH